MDGFFFCRLGNRKFITGISTNFDHPPPPTPFGCTYRKVKSSWSLLTAIFCPVRHRQFFVNVVQTDHSLTICYPAKMKRDIHGTKFGLVILYSLLFLVFATAFKKFSPSKYYSTCHSKDFGHHGTVCVCFDGQECDSFSEGRPSSHVSKCKSFDFLKSIFLVQKGQFYIQKATKHFFLVYFSDNKKMK